MRLPKHIKFASGRTLKLPAVGKSSQMTLPGGTAITATRSEGGNIAFSAHDKNGKNVPVKQIQLRPGPSEKDKKTGGGDPPICLLCVPDPTEEGLLICGPVQCPPGATRPGGGGHGKGPILKELPIHKE